MTSFVALFDAQREMMLQELSGSGSLPAQAGKILHRYLDRFLTQYNEQCENDRERQAAAGMTGMLIMSLRLLDCSGESRVWQQTGAEGTGAFTGRKERAGTLSKVLLIAGGLLMVSAVLSLLIAADRNPGVIRILICLVCMAASLAAVYLSGRWFGRKKKGKNGRKSTDGGDPAYYVEESVDPTQTLQAVRAALAVMDRELSSIRSEQDLREGREGSSGTADAVEDVLLSKQALDLAGDLLEAEYSGDGAFALERLGEVSLFLHRMGITMPPPDHEHLSLYDMMPGKESRVIRPALVRDGKLLKKGLTTGGM